MTPSDELPGPPTMGEVFAHQLRAHRRMRGLSISELAERCADQGAPGYTFDVIKRLEQGRRRVLLDDVPALAKALGGVSPSALMLPEENTPVAIDDVQSIDASDLFRWFTGRRNPFGPYQSLSAWLPYLGVDPTVVTSDITNLERVINEQHREGRD